MTTRHSRQPVLFLPGLLCDEDLWRDQSEALCDIVDSTIADLTGDDDIAAMARGALAVAAPRFALVALSMGGYVAFEILRQAPERVTSLVLLSTSAGSDDAQRRAQRSAGIEALQLGRFLGVTNRLLP
jgi:pimeloyl-ACP methyl ester carboxylesterase